ncbi:camphor resistance protein CrcB [Cellulosimicrobium cellulans]|uniref:Fluoride-specific ion channel FluC n=1 Tax=Cellulosimicrobium cellulans TaxID=1710 RepID=A0A1Y0HVP3_CELCE|nr:CrcB family protein [Cellulosimicrobium cellulans]ARU51334.1 camphor resistance protein CrcB [Cellulosimicrobium cellulans]
MTGVPELVLVAVAGGLGAASRFLLDTLVARHNRWSTPLGTVVVNVTACFLLGLLTGWGGTHPGHGDVAAVLGVGFLGGYSTFSTASVEGARLLLAGRGVVALVHALGMLVVCLAAAVAGIALGGA